MRQRSVSPLFGRVTAFDCTPKSDKPSLTQDQIDAKKHQLLVERNALDSQSKAIWDKWADKKFGSYESNASGANRRSK